MDQTAYVQSVSYTSQQAMYVWRWQMSAFVSAKAKNLHMLITCMGARHKIVCLHMLQSKVPLYFPETQRSQ